MTTENGQQGSGHDLSKSKAVALLAQPLVLTLTLSAMLFVLCSPVEAQQPNENTRG
jgi:hypothetical protein